MPSPFKIPFLDGDPQQPYTTQLAPGEEAGFQNWVKQNNVPWKDTPNADYDMRGYYQAQQAGDPNAKQAGNRHFPDTYKTPYDRTFSNQSKYATPDAPKWEGDMLTNKQGMILGDDNEDLGPAKPQDWIPPLGATPQIQAGLGGQSQSIPQLDAPAGPRVVSERQADREALIGSQQSQLADLNKPHMGQLGSSHPGTGGKILHGLATAGNILGDIFAPNVMARVPGTQMNNDAKKEKLEGEIDAENKVGTKEAADQSQLQSENTQRAANTDYLKAETEAKLHPPESQHDLAIAYGHRVKQVLAEGGDPATDPTTMKLQDAITGLQKQTTPTTKGFQHLTLKDPKTGGPMGANYDPNAGKFYDVAGNEIANPVPYEKPQQAPVFQMLTPTPTGDYQLKNFQPNQVIPQGAISKTGLNTIDTPTSQMRNTAARSELVHESVPEILQNVDANAKQLGPVMGNWNAFMQGKVGMDNPNFAQLRMDLLLFSSAVALAHAQGRLPENLREEFDHAINAPKQTPENLKAIIQRVDNSMVRTVGAMGGAPNTMKPTQTNAGAQGQVLGETAKPDGIYTKPDGSTFRVVGGKVYAH